MYWPRFFLDSGIMVSMGTASLGELKVRADIKITNRSDLTIEAANSIAKDLLIIYLLFTLYFLGTLQDEKRGAYQNSGANKKGKGEGFVEKYYTGPNPKGNRQIAQRR